MHSIFRISLFCRKEGLNESSRTPSWWSDTACLLCIPSSVGTTLPFCLILSALTAYRSDCHNFPWVKGTHTHNKLANKMQQHVCPSPLLYGLWCHHGNAELGTLISSTLMYYVEGHLGQEKTDLEVRISVWRRDVMFVIMLEFGFYRWSRMSLSGRIRWALDWPCNL